MSNRIVYMVFSLVLFDIRLAIGLTWSSSLTLCRTKEIVWCFSEYTVTDSWGFSRNSGLNTLPSGSKNFSFNKYKRSFLLFLSLNEIVRLNKFVMILWANELWHMVTWMFCTMLDLPKSKQMNNNLLTWRILKKMVNRDFVVFANGSEVRFHLLSSDFWGSHRTLIK